jgi:hypothetical protein
MGASATSLSGSGTSRTTSTPCTRTLSGASHSAAGRQTATPFPPPNHRPSLWWTRATLRGASFGAAPARGGAQRKGGPRDPCPLPLLSSLALEQLARRRPKRTKLPNLLQRRAPVLLEGVEKAVQRPVAPVKVMTAQCHFELVFRSAPRGWIGQYSASSGQENVLNEGDMFDMVNMIRPGHSKRTPIALWKQARSSSQRTPSPEGPSTC